MAQKVLAGLEPEPVYRYFEEICSIPHGSGNTGAICEYLVAFAKERGLRCKRDTADNVIIWKEGSGGYESAPPLILQGHLDMVCEKDSDCPVDMEHEGLQLIRDGKTITAKGTTLGGDDGIAVAFALAILDAQDIIHPPLEVILTADEEIGMLGAAALDCSPISSRTMLNLDSEEEGYFLVSCAGGACVTAHLRLAWELTSGIKADVHLTGLSGGHSGVEIDKGRGNACQLLGRCLYSLHRKFDFSLISLVGGQKDNAIPREASASLLIEDKALLPSFEAELQAFDAIFREEYKITDSGIRLRMEAGEETTCQVMASESAGRALTALCCLPNGIEKMSFDIPGLVQTSLNLGILSTTDKELTLSYSVRSSKESEKQALIERITCLTEALSGYTEVSGDYPAWEYRKNSPLRDTMVRIYEEKFGKKPIIQALHAGVECGIFAGKLPGLDCVSFGPDIKDIHTPKEALDTESVSRTWEYLLEILQKLPEQEKHAQK